MNNTQSKIFQITYFDQNEKFASCLPRIGTIEANFKFQDSDGLWSLLRLDLPILYEGTSYQRILVKSRWDRFPVGGVEPTSVFILLIPDEASPTEDQSYTKFQFVAWGMVNAIGP